MCNREEGDIVICTEKPKQCEQLFNDLVQIIKKNRKSHFFGSIVTSSANNGGKSDYLVIDGQQRITTISILFTSMVNLMKSEFVECSNITQNYYYFENRIKKNEISIDDFDCQTPKREKNHILFSLH